MWSLVRRKSYAQLKTGKNLLALLDNDNNTSSLFLLNCRRESGKSGNLNAKNTVSYSVDLSASSQVEIVVVMN